MVRTEYNCIYIFRLVVLCNTLNLPNSICYSKPPTHQPNASVSLLLHSTPLQSTPLHSGCSMNLPYVLNSRAQPLFHSSPPSRNSRKKQNLKQNNTNQRKTPVPVRYLIAPSAPQRKKRARKTVSKKKEKEEER